MTRRRAAPPPAAPAGQGDLFAAADAPSPSGESAAAPEPSGETTAAPAPHRALRLAGDEAEAPTSLSPLPDAFARQAARWAAAHGADAAGQALAARAGWHVSAALVDGHVACRLQALAADPALAAAGVPAADLPALRAALAGTGIVAPAQAPGRAPLVLDAEGRLYLHRYFDHERTLARRLQALHARASQPIGPGARAVLGGMVARAGGPAAPLDGQVLAVALALRGALAVISGGPGTGKTTTVVQLLQALLADRPADAPPLQVALAAPTGKAAARLAEALRERAATLPEDLRARLPATTHTVHRLLGATGEPGRFRHDAQHPLALDVLVVDEASMLDLALARRLVDAVPPGARLILLGDRDQLAAVESGAVFAELCADPTLDEAARADIADACGVPLAAVQAPGPRASGPGVQGRATGLHGRVAWLEKTWRFDRASALGRLALEVRDGRREAALATLRAHAVDADTVPAAGPFEEGGAPSTALVWVPDELPQPGPALAVRLRAGHASYLAAVRAHRAGDDAAVPALLRRFQAFRALAALREGPRGASALNRQLDAWARQGLAGGPDGAAPVGDWYPGRPVIVLRNDPLLQVANGDIGLTLPDAQGRLQVWLPTPDGGVRAVPPMRLPAVASAWAMTVHKSQGSEFDGVLLLLPARPGPVATRELLYTAITRSRGAVTVVGGAEVIGAAIDTPTRRDGGLAARLREAAAEG